jgi:hypothetical protein
MSNKSQSSNQWYRKLKPGRQSIKPNLVLWENHQPKIINELAMYNLLDKNKGHEISSLMIIKMILL